MATRALEHPAFFPFRNLPTPLGETFPSAAQLTGLATLHELRNGQALRLSFTPLAATMKAADYELSIWHSGSIPVQLATLHDRLNALVWLAFPRFKAALNAHHADVLLANPSEATQRGRRRDALTMLDEMGLLVSGPKDLLRALAAREWQRLFVGQRDRVIAEMSFTAVGHGLLEKALAPYPALTAKCLLLEVAKPPTHDELDAAAAAALDSIGTPAELPPLPICGIPGWWAANLQADFYTDTRVFRPLQSGSIKRTRR